MNLLKSGGTKESEICWKVNIKTIIERGYDLDIKNPIKKEAEQIHSSKELIEMLKGSFKKSNHLLDQLIKEIK